MQKTSKNTNKINTMSDIICKKQATVSDIINEKQVITSDIISKIGIYIHIPYCKAKCRYCNFVSSENHNSMQEYSKALLQEIELRSKEGILELSTGSAYSAERVVDNACSVGRVMNFQSKEFDPKDTVDSKTADSKLDECLVHQRSLERDESFVHQEPLERFVCDSIYIGGGTPSVFFSGGISAIADAIHRNYYIDKDLEFTVEANPESCNDDFLSECVKAGVNRLSLGLQSCNDSILKRAGRLHSFEDFTSCLKRARQHGIENVSADLILGLEGETMETFKATLKKLLENRLEHVSIYALKCEEGTPIFASGYEPCDDFVADLYDVAVETLKNHGLFRYEVSNFARPSFESRHNSKYWTLMPYQGFGLAAHSFLNGKRRANTDNMQKYLSGEFLSHEQDVKGEEQEEFLMLGLRMEHGISLSDYEKRFKKSLLVEKSDIISTLKSQGYIIIEENQLKIHPNHIYTMNQIITKLI